jgi:hypothetical protein
MGQKGDSTTFIYKTPRDVPPIDVQRNIIDWAERGMALESICRITKQFLPVVKNIIDRGVVYLVENEVPIRCPECGASLKASPCLRCELLTRNN